MYLTFITQRIEKGKPNFFSPHSNSLPYGLITVPRCPQRVICNVCYGEDNTTSKSV